MFTGHMLQRGHQEFVSCCWMDWKAYTWQCRILLWCLWTHSRLIFLKFSTS